MPRRLLLMLVAAIALWACSGGEESPDVRASTPAVELPREPDLDVLLITIDTLRVDALGAYGNSLSATPLMDRLAAAGVRFENARAHNVVTLPSHANIFTGLYPQEHGVRDNSGFRFPDDRPTLAGLLQQAGYRTGAFVSAFPLESRFGLDRGFDVYEDHFIGVSRRPTFLEQERSGAETVALAKSWIESSSDDRPWFCWVHLYEPHFPYAPPEPFASDFRDNPYLGEAAASDAALAPLLEPILAGNEGGQALVVLTSDHGEALGEHGEATHGIFAYENTLRVPLVFYQSRLLEPRVVHEMVRHVDLLPTILDILALPVPPDSRGRTLLPALVGKLEREIPPSYFEALSGQLNRGWAPLYGVVYGESKYIDLPIPELYELQLDPAEAHNLAANDPQRLAELQEILEPLRAIDTGSAPLPEDAETRRRLESLGYLSRTPSEELSYTEEDDPKLLIELDQVLREVGGLYDRGDIQRALERCRELVRVRPGMRLALMYLAHLERERGNLEAAVKAMREAYVLHPEDDVTLAMLASYLTQSGRESEAVEITESRAQLAHPDVDVLLVRGLALARSGRSEEAFATMERAREVAPGNPAVPVHLGTLHLMLDRRDEARAAYEEALTLNPDTVAAHTALGIMAIERGESELAVGHWRRAVAVDPQQCSRLLMIGTRLWSSGQTDMARPLLELFVETAPAETYREEIGRVQAVLKASG